MGLPESERISMIRLAVLTQSSRVTERQTDGQTDGIGVAYKRYSIYAVARKKTNVICTLVVAVVVGGVLVIRCSTRSSAIAGRPCDAKACQG